MIEVRHLVNSEAQTNDSGTYTYDLPLSGNLHSLLLKFQCTNGATEGHAVSMLDVVDDIEIIGSGQQTLYHMIPEVAEKLYETLYGRPLQGDWDEQASAVQEIVIPVFFGRELFDPEYFLPLSTKLRPQLRVDYSPTISATSGFATGTFTVDIVAVMSESRDVNSYGGTFVTRELRNFTSLASGDDATELSSLRPHRFLGVYCYEAGVADGTNVTRVRLMTKSRSNTPLDLDWDDFIIYNRELYGCDIEHSLIGFGQNNDTFNTRIGEIHQVSVEETTAVDTTNDVLIATIIDTIAGDTVTLDAGNVDVTAGAETITADATDRAYRIRVKGMSPSYFGLIPFDYHDNPNDWFRVQGKEKCEVVLTQGNAGADVRIISQELASF